MNTFDVFVTDVKIGKDGKATSITVYDAVKADVVIVKQSEIVKYLDSLSVKSPINLSTLKYSENEDNILSENIKRVLVYHDKDNKLFGFVSARSKSKAIQWIPDSSISEVKRAVNITDTRNVYTICKESEFSVLNRKSTLFKDGTFSPMSIVKSEEYESYLNLCHGIEEKTNESAIEECEATGKVEGNTCKSCSEDKEQDDSIVYICSDEAEAYMEEKADHIEESVNHSCNEEEKHIEQRLISIYEVEKILNSKIDLIIDKERAVSKSIEASVKLKEKLDEKMNLAYKLLNSLDDDSKKAYTSELTQIASVGSSNIDSFDVESDLYRLYETILKISKVGDITSIPIGVYKLLSVLVKSTVDSNMSMTSYTVVATIKFDRESSMGIHCIVYCDDEADSIKIQTLRCYGKSEMTVEEIMNYKQIYMRVRGSIL